MTPAKMGRSMKKRERFIGRSRVAARRRWPAPSAWRHRRRLASAWATSCGLTSASARTRCSPSTMTRSPAVKTFQDHPLAAEFASQLDLAIDHLVFGRDDEGEFLALIEADRTVRDQQQFALAAAGQADRDEHAGHQRPRPRCRTGRGRGSCPNGGRAGCRSSG